MPQATQVPSPFKTPAWRQQIKWVGDPAGYMESAASISPDIFKAEVVGFGGGLVFVNHLQRSR
jgi:cytochrome P450 family 110